MELSKYIACICEGTAEQTIMNLLLENNRLIFTYDDLLDGEVLRCRKAKDFEEQQEFLVIQRRRELRESNRKQQYYDDNESLLQVLEESYRNSVSE